MADAVRVDKFLWSVRVYKTRAKASDACKGNKVSVNGNKVKPSKMIGVGDTIEVRKGSVLFSYKVKELLSNRVGAGLVDRYIENTTSHSELEKLQRSRRPVMFERDRGTGRPTKKDRRDLDDLMDVLYYGGDNDISEDIAYKFGLSEDDDFL